MDDNVSRFTQISVSQRNTDASVLEQLTLYEGIYGVQEDDLLIHFYLKDVHTENVKNFLILLRSKGISFTQNIVEPTNWNKVWEDSFSPVKIGKTWNIRAEFHPPEPNFTYEIVISPKMAFGTGHHETTFMVLEQMATLDLTGKKVLDLGCGSGILAIAAEKLGASSVLAVDYDPLSVENTIENSGLNNCSTVIAQQADVYNFDQKGFDLILANINKKVLQDNILKIKGLLNSGGILIVSGILIPDKNELISILRKKGKVKIYTREKWCCIKYLNT